MALDIAHWLKPETYRVARVKAVFLQRIIKISLILPSAGLSKVHAKGAFALGPRFPSFVKATSFTSVFAVTNICNIILEYLHHSHVHF